MNDMSSVIVPKSDQINSDDLLSGPVTVTIRGVQITGGTEQPVSIALEGTDKFYRPCKSMSRVLVANWGPDAKTYVGRSLTLYRDPKVKWGGLEVGGIRISHMSHIDAPMTMALTTTRSNRQPFTVKPLVQQRQQQPAGYDPGTLATLDALRIGATAGMANLESDWKALSPESRKILRSELPALKKIAEEAEADDFSSPSSPAGTPTAEAGPTHTDGDAGAVQEGLPDEERGDGDADREARSAITAYIQAVKDAPDDAALAEVYTRGNELAATIRADFPDLYAEIDPFRPADAPERGEGGRG